jgi:hypothetical protein
LDFSELLNFEGDIGWVRFETVKGGRRFATEKSAIRSSGFYTFDNRCLCLQMGEEEFASLKILPLKVQTQRQQLGLDINLRPVAKTLSKQKYFVDSHYFMVVDGESQPCRMRVGCKVYGFRGTGQLSHFVECLAANPVRFNLDAVPKGEDYGMLLDGLRKELKLSARSLEESLALLVDRRKKEQLPRLFFHSTICPSLDLTPLICPAQQDLDLLSQELPSEVDLDSL